jgi:hypothetical protein
MACHCPLPAPSQRVQNLPDSPPLPRGRAIHPQGPRGGALSLRCIRCRSFVVPINGAWTSAIGTRCDGLPGRFVEVGCSCASCTEGRSHQHIVDSNPYAKQLIGVIDDL